MSAVGQSNPFSDASEYNTLDFIIARATDKMQTVSIGQVIAVNTGAQTVDVQILVNLVTGNNTPVEHEVIANRPYYRMQGGGNAIICDPVVGDIGVVVFASRDITGVVAAKSAANPSSNRRFSWSDGIYFGGVLNAAPTQFMQFLAAGGGINITSPGTVAINAPATTVSGTANVVGNTTLQATLAVTGTSTLTGLVTATAGLTAAGPITGTSAVFSGSVTASSFIGGGGGGGGTVTSVGISTPGVGVTVGGGPITAAGTLTVDLSSTAYAALALAVTALQSISIATGTGLTGGPLHASGSTVALSAATIASLLPASPVQGDIVYYTGSTWANLAPGTAGQVLQTGGTGANPSWVTSGSGTTAVPGTIPDLVLWWETDNILGTPGIPVLKLGDRTPWYPGAFANAGTGNTTSISATQLNGLNTLKFPTSDSHYTISTPFVLSAQSTIFAVVLGATSATAQGIIGGAASSGALSLSLVGVAGTAKITLVKTGSAIIGTGTNVWTVGTAFQCNVTYNSATGAFAFRQARAANGSGTSATTGTTGSVSQIGSDFGGTNFLNGGTLAAVIVYDRILTSTEITNVENYILAKWGV